MDSFWIPAPVVVPLFGALLGFLWPRASRGIGLSAVGLSAAAVVMLARQLVSAGPVHYAVGGWGAPLGIMLYVDGLSLLMLGITALVTLAIAVHAGEYFSRSQARAFWPLWLMLLGALNALFVSADIFNLYVTLELMSLAAVALTALGSDARAVAGAMRYLLAGLLGSLAYLLGVALLYHQFGTLDIGLLGARVANVPALWLAAGFMVGGLLLKTALFPLHFWLPAAHASAPSPVSAVLSALVIKASFYLLWRLWLALFAPFNPEAMIGISGALGTVAILWGSIQALRQQRLKLLIAYSTVAQVGYLFVGFALAAGSGSSLAWTAVMVLLLAHALAKSAMFLAAGNLMHFGGHDRIDELHHLAQRLPLSVATFGVAGMSIIGLPPSGGFSAKWLLLQSAFTQGRWDLIAVLLVGSLLAAAYVFKVIGRSFTPGDAAPSIHGLPTWRLAWPGFLLAIAAILLGLFTYVVMDIMFIGAPLQPGGGLQ